ncbi:MAG: hypothetical protein A2W52_03330 [Candidatus Taylorbacteria bacterium RIFCSPHIGHO2_02_49_25]|uniref:DUF4258 domain-containing protein n=1 Tax=Candidatus Taylorbacteria bacterium RIFCSPHIGHO2_02_49_25 TaxID=1802305 RepID=A0A1G2MDD1_9BACT|nr:MAG: hypothetical protein UY62_C0034G0006 [Parcubacteria group bacterium GW2011_GWF2_50_9]OHA20440.1 MAG: hypothetical protein A2759_02130 [Candidatus Taylorbacteria bacterium RIFCSPHIGHO2_01_FULL_49_60]OHA21907.1 MAG: hypothetical protein A2W52_03330 [Candidatus Taylorbacteria bacterium RIFCSPHIGHO2_02_49_25]OHA36645.1 MAG: hypothetical protein A2W65_00980 [Candidatus Taylorbacteria bacterium RIFCSPLOWO2_02_50_13]OHA37215.1 MAG: hypothetical protein A3B27_01510 [Candidatus Taylorbacteria ba
MKIVFSDHALLKMEQRKIPRSVVIVAVQFPNFRIPGYNFREQVFKKFKGIYLKVVIKRLKQEIIVVTAHLVARVKNN